ncbi:MAG: alpha/beta fold family hydrolase [Bacteriovoracaceae bacterium]|nr:alpha/beta fold family hydrolase [Bacteriovoracaceae bacterium]
MSIRKLLIRKVRFLITCGVSFIFHPLVFATTLVGTDGAHTANLEAPQPTAESNINKCLRLIASIPESFPAELERAYAAHPNTFDHYVRLADENAKAYGGQTPTGYDYEEDVRRSQTWSGFPGHPLFQAPLPEGATYIDHQLIAPMRPGLVKTSSGDFTAIRVNFKFNGKMTGTNVGLRRQALFDNIERGELGQPKTLVSKYAKAVLITFHGGGTNTTGFHVGITRQNHYGPVDLDTISIDLPFHGGGPRNIDSDEFFEWFRTFVDLYIAPSQTKSGIDGHSMGAQIADMYMRRYPKNPQEPISFIISLSGVPDMDPGKSVVDRLKGYSKLTDSFYHPEKYPGIAPTDMKMGEGLSKQGKMSPLALAFEVGLYKQNDQSRNLGVNGIPMLGIIGGGDWLYVGKEKLFHHNFGSLPNVQFKVYEPMPSFKSKMKSKGKAVKVGGHVWPVTSSEEVLRNSFEGLSDIQIVADENYVERSVNLLSIETPLPVGHQVFDLDGNPVFEDSLAFIAQTIGVKFEKPTKSRDLPLFATLIQAYANDLAFREFLKTYVVKRKVPIDSNLIGKMNLRSASLAKFIKNYEQWERQSAHNERQGLPSKAAPICDVDAAITIERARDELKDLGSIRRDYTPEGPEGALGRALLQKMNELETTFKPLKEEIEKLRVKSDAVEVAAKEIDGMIEDVLEAEASSPILSELLKKETDAFQKLKDAENESDQQIIAYHIEMESSGNRKDFSDAARASFIRAGEAAKEYQKDAAEIQSLLTEMGQRGDLGSSLKSLYTARARTRKTSDDLKKYISDLEFNYLSGQEKFDLLQTEMVNRYASRWYRMEAVQVSNILDLPTWMWPDFTTELKAAWEKWKVLRKDSGPRDEISTY